MLRKYTWIAASFAILSLLLSAGSATERQQSDTQHALDSARALLNQGRYQDARNELIELTRNNPGSLIAILLLGTAEVELHDLHAAETAFRRSIALNPKSSDAHYNLAVVLLDEGRPKEAIPHFENAEQLGSPRPELSINLVRAELEAGNTQRALQTAASAGRLFSSSPAFNLALGKCFLTHDLPSPAVVSLERADAQAPGQPEILMPLADACLSVHSLGCAETALSRIPGRSTETAGYHYYQGRLAFLLNEQTRALSEMQRATDLDRQNLLYAITLAQYCQKYGNPREAIKVLDQAESFAPKVPDIPYGIAVSHFIEDDFTAAADYSGRALRLDRSFDRATFLLGISRFAQGDLNSAETLLDRVIKLRPKNAFYRCFYGMILLSAENLPAAADEFREAIRLQPDYALPRYQLGRVLVRAQKYVEARTELERATSLDPQLGEAYYQLSRVYTHLGDKEKATETAKIFERFRTEEQNERTNILNEAHRAVQNAQ